MESSYREEISSAKNLILNCILLINREITKTFKFLMLIYLKNSISSKASNFLKEGLVQTNIGWQRSLKRNINGE